MLDGALTTAIAADTRTRRWWAVSGGASLLVHVPVVLGGLLLHVDGTRVRPAPTELQIVPVEPARPKSGSGPGGGAPSPAPPQRAHRPRPVFATVEASPAPAPEDVTVPDEQDVREDAPPADDDDGQTSGLDSGAGAASTKGGGTGTGSGEGSLTQEEAQPISPLEAAYLRLTMHTPALPRSLWQRGRTRYTIAAQICVTAAGQVFEVTIKQGLSPEFDATVAAAMRTWRYRSRMIGGKPHAFCHPMTIHYDID